MTYELFTKLLSSIGEYKKSIDKAKTKLEVLEYQETGVKGVSYTKMPMSHNPTLSALKRLDLVEEVDELKREINFYYVRLEENIRTTDRIMVAMPEELRNILSDKYIEGMTFSQIAEKYHYSESGIFNKMKRETEKYL